jgi:membrane-associated phospholipid phosphatase
LIQFARRFVLRRSEWILVAYFAYVACLAVIFRDRPLVNAQPFVELAAVLALLLLLAWLERRPALAEVVSKFRDWLPILLTLAAFREMELFLPRTYAHAHEIVWERQDHTVLADWHVQGAIEKLGPVLPFYLEWCYLWVYGVAAVCVGILYGRGKRALVDRFFTLYLLGTLVAYAFFPYFPSQPPRLIFPGVDEPHVTSWVRHFNLFILKRGTIHLGVFPSAHVSSAFAAAWAMFLLIPERKLIGWLLVVYAASVSIATIYGRYHYCADVLAGFAISLIPAGVALVSRARGGAFGSFR